MNHKNFYYIDDKLALRKKYGFEPSHYLVGSFQRDTEGSDLKSPKLIKGPDIFIKSVSYLYKKNTNLKVVLTGKRRQYVINELNRLNIPFNYFEMIDGVTLNDLYNVLDLYIVSSRIEGGPQAILNVLFQKHQSFQQMLELLGKYFITSLFIMIKLTMHYLMLNLLIKIVKN